MKKEIKIIDIRHPDYIKNISSYRLFRETMDSGKKYINRHLKRFSRRENAASFKTRADMTYIPSYAKSAIIEIRNSIFKRMHEVIRQRGPLSFLRLIDGSNGGIDQAGGSIYSFLGMDVLTELLSMGKVAVLVDRVRLSENHSKKDQISNPPYLSYYIAEEILSWKYTRNVLTSVLLKSSDDVVDGETDLVTGTKETYLHYKLFENGVVFTKYDSNCNIIDTVALKLKSIPVIILDIGSSLLTEAAQAQVTLLNISSSDVNCVLESNFPFYTEQYNPKIDGQTKYFSETDPVTGEEIEGSGEQEEVNVGVTKGRKYPIGTERPGFIHPSSEPLKVSMEKQEAIKHEIRNMVSLALNNLQSVQASAESKQIDNNGLESGLSCISLEIERGERQIVDVWSQLEGVDFDYYVVYPKQFDETSESDRVKRAENYLALSEKTPDVAAKREYHKLAVSSILNGKVKHDVIKDIHDRLDKISILDVNPEYIYKDIESLIVSLETAATVRGYDISEVKKAAEDHNNRVIRIAQAQSSASPIDGASRGITDLSTDSQSAKDEKAESQNKDTNPDGKKKVRGNGK